jgi:hypothetical protein
MHFVVNKKLLKSLEKITEKMKLKTRSATIVAIFNFFLPYLDKKQTKSQDKESEYRLTADLARSVFTCRLEKFLIAELRIVITAAQLLFRIKSDAIHINCSIGSENRPIGSDTDLVSPELSLLADSLTADCWQLITVNVDNSMKEIMKKVFGDFISKTPHVIYSIKLNQRNKSRSKWLLEISPSEKELLKFFLTNRMKFVIKF